MLISTAFFAADCICMSLTFEKQPIDTYMHHIFVGTGTLINIYCGGLVFTMNFVKFSVEITTIMLNARTFFMMFEMKDSIYFVVSSLIFMAQFFWLRIVLTWYIYFTKMFCTLVAPWPGFACYPFTPGKKPYEFELTLINRGCFTVYVVL